MLRGRIVESARGAIAGFGAGVALDDFGGGTSSLERLVRFPVERLKLERFLVAGLDKDDHERRQVVKRVLSLARSLSMRVTAEGVERDGNLPRSGTSESKKYKALSPVGLLAALAVVLDSPCSGAHAARTQ